MSLYKSKTKREGLFFSGNFVIKLMKSRRNYELMTVIISPSKRWLIFLNCFVVKSRNSSKLHHKVKNVVEHCPK